METSELQIDRARCQSLTLDLQAVKEKLAATELARDNRVGELTSQLRDA